MPATKTKPAPTFYRSAVTERLVFPAKPSVATRRALRMAGFRWSGFYWFRTQSHTSPIKDRELSALLTPVAANDNDAPDINDVIASAL